MRGFLMVVVTLVPGVVRAQTWQDVTSTCIGTTAEWTNKVEVADLDKNGRIDLLFANGGNYSSPGQPEAARVFLNMNSALSCAEASSQVLQGFTGLSRMIKVADTDGDGGLDVLTGGAYQTQAKLAVSEGTSWKDATTRLPQVLTSIGDAEFGDVDSDGDLDLVLADWGATNPGAQGYPGGRTRLYLNDAGTFTDATATQMPDLLVKWSWDVELADVDNDWDLDVLVACKLCTTSYLFRNDGAGTFTNDPDALPHFANNYDFEPMDIDKDGDLDLVTINDGPSITEHILVNRGDGTFADETSTRLTGTANPAGADDNVAVWLDYDADADPDLMIGTLGNDRLLQNNGTGTFTLVPGAATPNTTPGTLGLAVADLDGDGRLDVVQGQGEVALPDRVYLATSNLPVDNVPPVVAIRSDVTGGRVYARVHDFIGPLHVHDVRVEVRVGGELIPMGWYGEMLWRAEVPAGTTLFEVCARDRRLNETCVANGPAAPDAGTGGGGDGGTLTDGVGRGGGCCETGRGDARGALVLALLVGALLSARTRSRARRCRSARRHRS